MLAIGSVVVVILLSLIITRVATVVLTLTGLSRESARFQARSAFSGVGFTTSEAEAMVAHPVRRRVVMLLMLIGSAGLVAVVASLVVSFSRAGGEASGRRLGVLIGGLALVWIVARSRALDRLFTRVVRRALRRWTDLEVPDYAGLLELGDGWAVAELYVREGAWVADRPLGELRLRDEGLAVLGIHRADDQYLGVPVAETLIVPGDRLLIYGRGALVADIEGRPAGPEGERAHAEAVRDQRATLTDQLVRDAQAAG